MLQEKKLNILFIAGVITIFSGWIIMGLSLNNSLLTVLPVNIALASPASNNTNTNTPLISSNLTNTTLVEDSNGTLTTIPDLGDRRHVPLQ